MKFMPKMVWDLYNFLPLNKRIFLWGRWALCPFDIIEKNVSLSGKIIDAGCGYGMLSNYISLKSTKRKVYGFDLNKERIGVAKKTELSYRNASFELKDVRKVNLGEIDCVVMSDFLHHLEFKSQEEFIDLCFSRLRKGGSLILQEAIKGISIRYALALLWDRLANYPDKIYYRRTKEWMFLLESKGFKVTIIRPRFELMPDLIFKCIKK